MINHLIKFTNPFHLEPFNILQHSSTPSPRHHWESCEGRLPGIVQHGLYGAGLQGEAVQILLHDVASARVTGPIPRFLLGRSIAKSCKIMGKEMMEIFTGSFFSVLPKRVAIFHTILSYHTTYGIL